MSETQNNAPAVDALREWMLALEASLADGSFVQLALTHYAGQEADLKGLQVRRVIIKRQEKLSFTSRYKTRVIVKNADIPESLRRIARAFEEGFKSGSLFTTGFDLVCEQRKGDRWQLRKAPATHTQVPSLTHDRVPNRLISSEEKPYLHALGITDQNGRVLKSAQDKYRQINRYVELLAPMITPDMIRVADMGSGKGYLTFALYDYMAGVLNLHPQMTGVEQRGELVALCNRIAGTSGYDGLRFVQGTIAAFEATGVNVLIALHACDTATDDALAKGIEAGADLIVVAPCCHKQVRREMEKAAGCRRGDFLLRHGIFLERQAEMVTDGLRALILEYHGYTARVFEFISDAHTHKNVMIAGQKNPGVPAGDPAILAKIHEAKARFGIAHHYLESLCNIPAAPDKGV